MLQSCLYITKARDLLAIPTWKLVDEGFYSKLASEFGLDALNTSF